MCAQGSLTTQRYFSCKPKGRSMVCDLRVFLDSQKGNPFCVLSVSKCSLESGLLSHVC